MTADNPTFRLLTCPVVQHCLTCHRAGELLQGTVSFPVPAIVESPSDPGTQLLVSWEELKQGRRWVEGEGQGRVCWRSWLLTGRGLRGGRPASGLVGPVPHPAPHSLDYLLAALCPQGGGVLLTEGSGGEGLQEGAGLVTSYPIPVPRGFPHGPKEPGPRVGTGRAATA